MVSVPNDSNEDFKKCSGVLSDLGLVEVVDKSVAPAIEVEFLGILFNTDRQMAEVTPDPLLQITELIGFWLGLKSATKRELQSLVGKLNFVCKCVLSSRVFISRMLAVLIMLKRQNYRFKIKAEFRADFVWWKRFLRRLNGVTYIPSMIWSEPNEILSTDACLSGAGGWCVGSYFSCKFSQEIMNQDHHINGLELLTILIACRSWARKLSSLRIQVYCDNLSSVSVIISGKTKDSFMLKVLREILFIGSTHEFQIRAVHLAGLIIG